MKRTLKGFIWFCWGQLSWFITGGCGCHMYLRGCDNGYKGFLYHVGGWLVSQYGYSRNPEWPSKNELTWYRKNNKNKESATTCL